MGRYATKSTVPVERTRAEIEATLIKYGANAFRTGWDNTSGMIAFVIDKTLMIRFTVPLPDRKDKRFFYKKDRRGHLKALTDNQSKIAYEQDVRQRWRALLLAIKGKLEAVEVGISSYEKEFLAHIVLPDERMTVGEWLASEVLPAIRDKQMPQLGFKKSGPTAGPSDASDVVDVEFTAKD